MGSLKLVWPAHGHDMGMAKIFTNTNTLSDSRKGTVESSPRVPPLTTDVFFDALHACDVHFAIRRPTQSYMLCMLKTQHNGLPARWSNSCKNESNRTVSTMDVESDALRVHSCVLPVARSYKQLPNLVVRIAAHVETFRDATSGRATRWREDSGPAGTL
jgi:hypothetical protein